MTRPFAWLHLRADLPSDWEMITYSLDPDYGELEFATRPRVEARFTWERKRPSRDRRGEPPWTFGEEESEEEGQLLSAHDASRKFRFTWWFPEATETTRAVLDSSGPQEGDARRLTLYGIRAVFSTDFTPETVQVFPANHMLSLAAKDHRRLVYRRWGLPDAVLRGETESAFFRKLLEAEGMRVESEGEQEVLGHRAAAFSFSSKGLTPLDRLRFHRAQGAGWIWREAEGTRLCTLEQLGNPGAAFPEPEACFDVQ